MDVRLLFASRREDQTRSVCGVLRQKKTDSKYPAEKSRSIL